MEISIAVAEESYEVGQKFRSEQGVLWRVEARLLGGYRLRAKERPALYLSEERLGELIEEKSFVPVSRWPLPHQTI